MGAGKLAVGVGQGRGWQWEQGSPRSSWLWDVVNGSDHDDHDINEDQGETEMDYQSVVYGLFRVLAQYANRQIDFIDEDLLTAGGYVITQPLDIIHLPWVFSLMTFVKKNRMHPRKFLTCRTWSLVLIFFFAGSRHSVH